MVAVAKATTFKTRPFEMLRRKVPARILERGRAYFEAGAVLRVESGSTHAKGLVKGTELQPYEVKLCWSGRDVEAFCNCPYDWSDVCKHVTEADILQLMAELTNMRMIANGLLLLLTQYPSPKLEELAEILDGLLSQRDIKVVVFSQWERIRELFDGLFKEGSNEVLFDDESRMGLVDRMRQILGEGVAKPSLPDEGIVARQKPIDQKIREVQDGVVPLPLADPFPTESLPVTFPDSDVVSATDPINDSPHDASEIQLDLSEIAQGLFGLLGVTASKDAIPYLPLTVRREHGLLKLDLPDVPEPAWQHLQAFVAALGHR